ncbi:uncharacterized protein [Nicotiana tomentosiformis]|uniref:uncharacterized protein n=1 Tax=Nicotiana tomentosiformis TaxID=4098 RepID=UPI00388CB2D5
MDNLIDKSQVAFVSSRVITDNIILSHELMKGYGRKGVSPRCMIKIDMQKAYDSIEWVFLEQVLNALNFPEIFVRWIMVCISTVLYSVVINGKPSVLFTAKRGVRQGDPLSPFLFVIAMEYLSRLLKTLTENPDFNYHPRCDKLNIIQLGFADDLLLFYRGDVVSTQLLYKQFQQFSLASGLIANQGKSDVYFGGVPSQIQQQIIQKLGFSVGSLPFREIAVDQKCTHSHSTVLVPSFHLAKEGGLNIVDIYTWNKTAILKHYWNLCKKKDRLCIQWVHIYYTKGNEVWENTTPQASWLIQKILKAKQYLESAGVTIEEFLNGETYAIKTMYNKLRDNYPKTKMRLKKWDMGYDTTCPLCDSDEEDVQYLFFKFPNTYQIWQQLFKWQGIQRQAMGWKEEIEWAQKHAYGNNAKAEIYRMTLAGSVYYTWLERNNKIFLQRTTPAATIVRQIIQDIHCRGRTRKKLALLLKKLDYYPS